MNSIAARMKAVRRKNTTPELFVRSVAHSMGLRFRTCDPTLPGSPDVVFPRHRVCVLVHGCFWHRHPGCSKASFPKSNQAFWKEKFERNVARDVEKASKLADLGWRVLTIWECETLEKETVERKLRPFFDHRRETRSPPPAACRR